MTTSATVLERTDGELEQDVVDNVLVTAHDAAHGCRFDGLHVIRHECLSDKSGEERRLWLAANHEH
jgi:hypothetical protein